MAGGTGAAQRGVARLSLAQDPDADALLSDSSFALVVGMLLDQQVTIEKAFAGPAVIAERIGTPGELDPVSVADYDPDAFAAALCRPPAVHRYPAAMAGRVQALARLVVDTYGGDADAIWTGVGAQELLGRLRALPGFGERKAMIFLALLGKQRGVRPRGWRTAAGEFGVAGTYLSVADVVDAESLARVRATKREAKAAAKAAAPG